MYEQVNDWEKVCLKLGHDPKVLPDVSLLPKETAEFTINSFKARMIALAYNKVDKENGERGNPRYMPYFYKSGGGFHGVLRNVWYGAGFRDAAAGLCFITESGAQAAGEDHISVYEALD